MQITPLKDTTFGAVVTDVRLAELDEAAWQKLYVAWLDRALLIFPAQHLTRDQQIAFAHRFGEPEFAIAPISNTRADGSVRDEETDYDAIQLLNGNLQWHTDSTYMPLQAKGAVFSAEIVPASGGETGWADVRAGYDALSDETKAKIEDLAAYHSLVYSQGQIGHHPKDRNPAFGAYGFNEGTPPLRKLVKVHPETGRKCLVIGRHAHAIPGLPRDESDALLTELVAFVCQPPRVFHHTWKPGDVVVWDNRALLHRSRPWNMKEPRVMWHSRIKGDPASEAGIAA